MAMHRRRRLSQAINTRRGIARKLFHVGPSTAGAANWAGNRKVTGSLLLCRDAGGVSAGIFEGDL